MSRVGGSCECEWFDVVEGFFDEDGFIGSFPFGLYAFAEEEEGKDGCYYDSESAHYRTDDCTNHWSLGR